MLYVCSPKIKGELSEWLKEHAWKVCIPLKGIEGSNPSLSARMPCKKVQKLQNVDFQFFALFHFWQMVQKRVLF
jgi:hypothetical protein